MLKGVCVCTFECVRRLLCKWGGKLYALEIWEVRAFFYGHFMLREGLFMAAGYCFLQVWLLLLERGIKRAESGGDYTSLCCASIWGDHLSRVHSQRRDLVKPRGTQCPCYLGDRLHKHKHRHINTCVLFLCAKTLHVEMLALMHNQKHALWCAHMDRQTALLVTRVICTFSLVYTADLAKR